MAEVGGAIHPEFCYELLSSSGIKLWQNEINYSQSLVGIQRWKEEDTLAFLGLALGP
jgi:hypothetical protein